MRLETLQARAEVQYDHCYDEHGHSGAQTIQVMQVLAMLAVAGFMERIAVALEEKNR